MAKPFFEVHLYLHIPFCKQACHYCDFHFSTSLAQKEAMIAAICQEIDLRKGYLPNAPLETIYFGGGTPSLLTQSDLSQIFNAIYRNFVVAPNVEITLEANPDDLTLANIKTLRPFINRLSIGLQSFDDRFLKFMNRAHNAGQSERCVKDCQDADFENISVDLIYGSVIIDEVKKATKHPMPVKTQAWEKGVSANDIFEIDLQKILALNVPHISTYSLTIEPKTVLGNWLKKGKIENVNDDTAAQQLETLMNVLPQHGYDQYEVSNFGRAGWYSQHNSCYWKRRSYLGIGPSAHSYNGSSRQHNIANNSLYINKIRQQENCFEIEHLTTTDLVNEYLLTSLRTIWGCEVAVLNEISGVDFLEQQQQTIANFLKNEWISLEKNVLLLTKKGKLLADGIAAELFL